MFDLVAHYKNQHQWSLGFISAFVPEMLWVSFLNFFSPKQQCQSVEGNLVHNSLA